MNDALLCQSCGAPLTEQGVLGDKCLTCLLELGLAGKASEPGAETRFLEGASSLNRVLGAGTHVGHYRIIRPIGEGGMGAVYDIRDLPLSIFVSLLRRLRSRFPLMACVSALATSRELLRTGISGQRLQILFARGSGEIYPSKNGRLMSAREFPMNGPAPPYHPAPALRAAPNDAIAVN